LARAKDNILNSFLFRYDTREKVLAERERLEFYGYPADYLESYKAALEKVTLADLDRVAKKYIHPDKLAVWWWAMGRRSSRAGRTELGRSRPSISPSPCPSPSPSSRKH